MSKIYDALLKAQREQRALELEGHPQEPHPEPQPRPQTLEPRREGFPKTPFPSVTPERIVRVNVRKFVAAPNSIMAEQFRKLRSVVTTRNLAQSLRSVLITSCMPGEGKTKVAINLAVTIARGLDDSVILIDADLRKTSLSSLLGLKNTLGLSDVLAGKTSINETLISTDIKGLSLFSAGLNRSNPAELIGSLRMRSLVEQLKQRYKNSYILIDSTPIVSTSEASILSQMVDGVIMVILADQTRRDVVKRELKTIDAEKLLGVVLNCAEFDTAHYYHQPYQIS